MSQAAALMAKRPARPLLVLAAAGLVALGVGAVLYFTSRPQSLPGKLADWIAEREPSCLGGKPKIDRSPPSARPDLYPDLLPYAESLAVVACDDLGPVTIVLKFGSHAELARAFATSTTARHDEWCFTGREAFDGSTLDRGWLPAFCQRLHGTVH